jgi:phage FluMu protein Com
MDLRDHLVHCGTKTDQCPQCNKFIQRAFFAYHYENNCANVNEIEGSKETNNSHPTSSSRNGQSYSWNKAVSIPCQFCQEICTGEKIYSHQVNIY